MRTWKHLPMVARWLLVTLTIIAVAAAGVYAYRAVTITGDVTVIEPITLVGDPTFAFDIYPQETVMQDFTLANASSLALSVDVIGSCTPDPGGDLTITVPNNVTVPATGQVIFTVEVTSSKSAPPATYSCEFGIDR